EPTGNLDSEATLDVLQLFESLHEAGQTLVIVTHDARIAATADRLISMRDGAFVDDTRLTGGTAGNLGALGGLDGGRHEQAVADLPSGLAGHPAAPCSGRVATASDYRRVGDADDGAGPPRGDPPPVPADPGDNQRRGCGRSARRWSRAYD